MSLISAATILTPFYRFSLSRADFVARNTAHTATSPVAMKNYLPFVEKERHQSPWMMKRNEDHRFSALHLRLFHVASRQQPRLSNFLPSSVRLPQGRLKLSKLIIFVEIILWLLCDVIILFYIFLIWLLYCYIVRINSYDSDFKTNLIMKWNNLNSILKFIRRKDNI